MKHSYSWYLDLYKRLEVRTCVGAIVKGVTVVKKKVGVGRQVIIKINTHFIKQDLPDGFENRVVLTSLRQEVGRGSEVG